MAIQPIYNTDTHNIVLFLQYSNTWYMDHMKENI